MIFYTADPHFGYEPVIAQTNRPFLSAFEMDEVLICRWNETVSDDDTVYLLGDLGGYNVPFPDMQLSQLKGHKHLIRGNHDTGFEDQQRLFDHFESVTDFLEIDDGEHHITLCHYPLVYIQSGYMIHGHVHNTQKEVHRILTQLPRVLNAGVDINKFFPVTLEQLIENNREYYNNPQRGCTMKWDKQLPYHKNKWRAVFYPLPTKR